MVELVKNSMLLLILISNFLLLMITIILLYRYSIKPYLQKKKPPEIQDHISPLHTINFTQLRTITEIVPFPMAISDNNGLLQYANLAFRTLTMGKSKGYKNTSIENIFDQPGDQTSVITYIQQSITDKPSDNIEYSISSNDNTVPVLLSFSPIQIDTSVYCMIIARDLSETEKYIEKIAHLQKLASIGTFAAGIVHEFNNVLTGIKGYSQLARKDYTNSEMLDKAFSIIESESQRGAELCKNMNYYSSSTKINPEPVMLKDIVDTVIALQNNYLSTEGIEISTNLQALPLVLVDKFQLQQVLLNMVINARHAIMPKGGGSIQISLSLVDEEIQFHISDTGIGIDRDNVKRIFDPFYTSKGVIGKSVSNYKIKGTGLGLAVSRSIIHKHGGSIEVTSIHGKGSTFTIKLPYKPAKQVTKPDIQAQLTGIPSFESRNPLKVLVIDDEMPIREMLFRALTDMDIMVTLAKNAEEGLTQCKADNYDVIFLDYVLPEMNGDKLIPVIKEHSPSSKIIFISGWDSSPQKKKNLESSVHAWIDKPFNLTQILNCLNEISTMPLTH